jgi:transposase-like protein
MNEQKQEVSKEAIIAEYLAGGISYRELGTRYGMNFRKIHRWVLAYQGKVKKKASVKLKLRQEEDSLPIEVKQLRRELRKAQLHAKLLEAMINIGQQEYGIDLRKKAGAKQS